MSVPCELGVENKLNNELKIENFPHKMSIISNFFASNLSKQNQLILIYNSKIGEKSMYLGE